MGTKGNREMTLQKSKIMRAAKKGDMKTMDKMMDKIMKPLNATDMKGNSALMNAIIEGHEDMAQRLIEMGVALDTRNRKGQTAVMLAIQANMEKATADLIEADADLDVTDRNGMTAFFYAAELNSSKITQTLTGDLYVTQISAYETGDTIYAKENDNVVSVTSVTPAGEKLRSIFDFNAKMISYEVSNNNNKGILVETFTDAKNKHLMQQAAKFLGRQREKQYGLNK